jgi:hypothetical protein
LPISISGEVDYRVGEADPEEIWRGERRRRGS